MEFCSMLCGSLDKRGVWRRKDTHISMAASLVAQLVKNLPAMQETRVWSLGWEDILEKGKATHSSILAWRIPWTVYSPWGRKELDTTEWLSLTHSRMNSGGPRPIGAQTWTHSVGQIKMHLWKTRFHWVVSSGVWGLPFKSISIIHDQGDLEQVT